jgi:glycosyltransferase involved in cell wall biosynthesis
MKINQKITAEINSSKYHKFFLDNSLRSVLEDTIGPTVMATRYLLKRSTLIFVCSKEEAQRLIKYKNQYKINIISHFVENRKLWPNANKIRKDLALNNSKIITVLGFIHHHDRKGHRIMLEAMPHLPKNVKVIFAGGPGPGSEKFVDDLKMIAKDKMVDDRLIITGFLSEKELEKYLTVTDLAVCPFRIFAASGSLSTWISTARPILASDNPQIQEYNLLEPEAIKIFKPYSAVALAKKIEQILPSCDSRPDLAVNRLRKKLSISNIFEQHLKLYNLAINQV